MTRGPHPLARHPEGTRPNPERAVAFVDDLSSDVAQWCAEQGGLLRGFGGSVAAIEPMCGIALEDAYREVEEDGHND